MANSRTHSESQASGREPAPPRPGPNVSSGERLRKLTVATMFGKLEPMQDGEPTRWLGDFYCQVTGAKVESSQYGDFTRWLGDFRSIDLNTGEIRAASTAIFPPIASDLINAAFMGGANIGGAAQNVMLAFRIGTAPDRNRAGYRFVLKDIQPATYKSPLDMFIEDAYRQPALPAPSEDEREAAD